MISSIANLNWLAVLAAFVAYSVVGALWFTVLFTKPYRISLGKENEPQQKLPPIFIIGPAICTLVITITSAILMNVLHIESFGSALEFALLIGFGYLVSNTVTIAINPNIPRPILYGVVSGSYHLVGIVIACMIIVAIG
jgi:Protein of unknown function (DUF1761)